MIATRSRTNRTEMIVPFHFRPRVPLSWRILTYDKRRTGLALIGIFMAILLVFIELGFFYAVPRGGLLLYDNMKFDLLLASNEYEYQAQPGAFPLSQLGPVRSSPNVEKAAPIYFGYTKWKSGEGGVWPDVFVIGFDPESHIVTLGAIQLKPGVDPDRAADDLRKVVGSDLQIFTHKALEAHETAYWTTRTSVGIIFGSGLLISFVVGIMIVYQIVSTQVSRQLPQFATMKAIGYPDRSLAGTVSAMSLLIVIAGFIPALGAALGLYSVIRQETLLPVTMSEMRLLAVLAAALAMALISALLSVGSLRRAA